jgi:hypothetical protein
MQKNGSRPRSLEDSYRADAAAGPLWMHLNRKAVTLALFCSCTFSGQADAYVRTSTDKLTEIHPSKQVDPYHRDLQRSSGVTGSETPEQGNHPACKKAEQLYEAASADARTLERAIFLSAVRREVERALGRPLTDDELRTLADQARAEAHRWYKYIQADDRCAASWHGELRPPQLNQHV